MGRMDLVWDDGKSRFVAVVPVDPETAAILAELAVTTIVLAQRYVRAHCALIAVDQMASVWVDMLPAVARALKAGEPIPQSALVWLWEWKMRQKARKRKIRRARRSRRVKYGRR